jgi:hypothetical protein
MTPLAPTIGTIAQYVPEVKPGAIHEPLEQRALFEKTLAAIRDIIGDLEEISSKRLVDELARIEGSPWPMGQGQA